MSFRSGAAICGAFLTLVFSSAAMAQSGPNRIDPSLAISKSGATITGAASTYNPHWGGRIEGGVSTASGERYDVSAWAAAIKTTLRNAFGGVHFGSKPKYALVEGAGKQAIVKINDVGPLEPGRIIDLNERTMRYFDPGMARGVIHDVKVTPLAGSGWKAGPVAVDSRLASAT